MVAGWRAGPVATGAGMTSVIQIKKKDMGSSPAGTDWAKDFDASQCRRKLDSLSVRNWSFHPASQQDQYMPSTGARLSE